MDPQNPGQQSQTPGGQQSYYQPPVPQQQFAVAGPGQPDLVKRGIAALIDFVGIGILYVVLYVPLALALGSVGIAVAAAVGLGATLLRDILLQGRSPGKKIMGLAVVTNAGGPITAQESIKRNSTLAIGSLARVVGIVPIIGWAFAILLDIAAFGLGCYELYLVATNQPRLGDKIAGTRVIAQGQPAVAL